MQYHNNLSFWSVYPRPSKNDFEIDVVSRLKDFDGKTFKKYNIDGMETLGVFGDEPFEVHFKNNSYEDVQIRLSIDGVDVLSGSAADLEINEKMWLVKANKTLHLKAWPENNKGGAQLVFTSNDKGVASHTINDVSHKGIIAAAIFSERNREKHYSFTYNLPMIRNTSPSGYIDTLDIEREVFKFDNKNNINNIKFKSNESVTSVGAGSYVEQNTKTVKGLKDPVLNSIIRVKYVWWDELVEMVKSQKVQDNYPSGFPGEKIKSFCDLKNTPRIQTKENTFDRFSK